METPSYSKLPAVGASIDGYKIQSLLGRGGMGAVYKAQKNGADYALKLMLNYRSELDYKRFEREAQAVAAVDLHPNIARIHHFGRCAGNAYMVFDYIEGGSLEDYLKDHPKVPVYKALRIAMGIADALSHIHSKGIIHRDLKPGNILLDDEGRPLLTDFGLVKQFQVETLTKTNETVGTPKYMAPEQMMGKGVSAATDIWALGVLLFETLTQSLPFEGESAVEIGHQVVYNPPIKPRLLRNDLPESVEQLILICLTKDPKQRYQKAANFKSECQLILQGEDIEHREVRPAKEGSKLKRFLVVLSILLTLGSLILFLILPAVEKQQFIDAHGNNTRHAKIALKNARSDFELFYVQELLKVQNLLPKESKAVKLPKDLSKRVKQIGQLFVDSGKSADLLDQRQLMISDSQIRELRWWLVLQKTCDGKKLTEKSVPSRDERSLRGLWRGYQALAKKDWIRSETLFLKLRQSDRYSSLACLGLYIGFAGRKQWEQAESIASEFIQKNTWPLRLLQQQLITEITVTRFLDVSSKSRQITEQLARFQAFQEREEKPLWTSFNERLMTAFKNAKKKQQWPLYLRIKESSQKHPQIEVPTLDKELLILLIDEYERVSDFGNAFIHSIWLKKMAPKSVKRLYRRHKLDNLILKFQKLRSDLRAQAEIVDKCSRAGFYIEPNRRAIRNPDFLKYFDEQLKKDPKDPFANCWRGLIVSFLDDKYSYRSRELCVLAFDRALKRKDIKGSLRAVVLLRRCQIVRDWKLDPLVVKGEDPEAIAELRKELKDNLDAALGHYHPRPHRIFIELYNTMGAGWEGAYRALENAESNLKNILKNSSLGQLDRGRPPEYPRLHFGGDLDKEWRAIYQGMARVHRGKKDWTNALKLFNKAISYTNGADSLWVEKGEVLIVAKKYEAAKEWLKVLKKDLGPPRITASERPRVFEARYIRLIERMKAIQ